MTAMYKFPSFSVIDFQG